MPQMQLLSFFSLAACFSPSTATYKKYYNALENITTKLISKRDVDHELLEKHGFVCLRKCDSFFLYLHTEQNVVYKIYYGLFDYGVHNRGEDDVKHIKSDYICKIYDIINVETLIPIDLLPNLFKIVALETLGNTLCYNSLVIKYKQQNSIEKMRELKDIVRSVVLGINDMHKNNIVHLDIRPENIASYRDKNGRVKYKILNDGNSQNLNTKNRPFLDHKPAYRSPQRGESHIIRLADDIWNIGMLTYVLYTGSDLTDNHLSGNAYDIFVINRFLNIDSSINDENLKDFIKKCLEYEPEKRPTAENLKEHFFLKSQ